MRKRSLHNEASNNEVRGSDVSAYGRIYTVDIPKGQSYIYKPTYPPTLEVSTTIHEYDDNGIVASLDDGVLKVSPVPDAPTGPYDLILKAETEKPKQTAYQHIRFFVTKPLLSMLEGSVLNIETVLRKDAIEFLSGFRDDTSTIKIICGVRRCGKSTLMMQYIDELKMSGVKDSNIVFMNLELSKYTHITDSKELMTEIQKQMGEGRNYILIDEVQNVDGWERAINAIRADGNSDIYLTGSNSNLLSSELATHLAGRYVSHEIFPLSFKEYLELNGNGEDKHEMFERYLEYGAFPSIDPFESEGQIRNRLSDLYDSIILRDVISCGKIKDPAQLEKIAKFMMINIGNPISVGNIVKETNVDRKTVEKYMRLLEEANIFYRADRFDIKGTSLNPNPKYYAVDTGLRNMPLDYTTEDYGRLMENIVYLELKRRGYVVTVGKYGDKEIDFTVKTPKGHVYYQVTRSMLKESVQERELTPLRAINDNYPKVVISSDRQKADFRGGVKHINIVDWLLDIEEDSIRNY